MRAPLAGAVLCSSLLSLSAGAQGARRAVPADALALHRIDELAWSPDSRALLFTVASADTARRRWSADIWVADSSGAHALVTGPSDDRAPRWSPDGSRIAFISDRDSSAQIWLVPARGGAATQLTHAGHGVGGFDWMPDGAGIAFTSEAGNPGDSAHRRPARGDPVVVGAGERQPHLWYISVVTGAVKEWAHLDGALANPRVDPRGTDVVVERRPSTRADDEELSDLVRVSFDGRVTPLTTNLGNDWSASWSADGEAIAFLTSAPNAEGADVAVMWPGASPHIIPALAGYDARAPQLIPSGADKNRLTVSAIITRGVSARVWTFGPDGARAWTEDTSVVSSAAWSPDLRVLATVESGPMRPAELYLRRDGRRAERATELNAVSYQMGAARVVRWKGADGLALDGVIVTPPGYSGGRRPVIVRLHGGPYGGFTLAYDPFAQLLAGRGYVVFEPNFRGSSAHGEHFAQLIRQDYGGKHVTDILLGIDHLIATEIADSTRLGVYGWSFGGYTTQWLVTRSRRFAAAVAGAGMSDLVSHYGTSDVQRYREFMAGGTPWDSTTAAYLWSRSPLRFADRARTPLLLLHGEADRRVPITQSEELYTALRRVGAPVEMVRYPREPHGFLEPLHQVDRDRRIADWFDKYMTRPALSRRD